MSISMCVVSLSTEIDCFLKEKTGIFTPTSEQKASLYFFNNHLCVCSRYVYTHIRICSLVMCLCKADVDWPLSL